MLKIRDSSFAEDLPFFNTIGFLTWREQQAKAHQAPLLEQIKNLSQSAGAET